jgi:hypothetical protein
MVSLWFLATKVKTPSNLTTLLIAAAFALIITPLSAIKIVVPDQYKDQVEAINEAELAEREKEFKGVAESAEGGIQIVGEDKPEQPDAAETPVEDGEFMVQQVAEPLIDASETLGEGEGRIAGQVFDKESGQPLRGVAILVEGTDFGTVTDSQGRYRISNVPSNTYSLSFIKSGYIEATVTDTRVTEGELMKLDFALPPRPSEMSDEVYVLQDFTVTAEEAASQNVALLALRQQSVASIDAISAESMARFAASDAAEALTKVTGVSISDGKYVVVRGLNDRYNTTLLNGIRFPSPDPDRKAVPMDIFPSGMIERIVTRKTFTAQQPGESSGGSIDIITRPIPEEAFVKFSTSVGMEDGLGKMPVDPEAGHGFFDFLSGPSDIGFSSDSSSNYPNSGTLLVAGGEIIGVVDAPEGVPSRWPRFQPEMKSVGPDHSTKLSFGAGYDLETDIPIRVGFSWSGDLFRKSRSRERLRIEEEFVDSNLFAEQKQEDTSGSVERGLSSVSALGIDVSGVELGYNHIYINQEESTATLSDTITFDEGTSSEFTEETTGAQLGNLQRTLNMHQFRAEFSPELSKRSEFSSKIGFAYVDAKAEQAEPDLRSYENLLPSNRLPVPLTGTQPIRIDRGTVTESEVWKAYAEVPFAHEIFESIPFIADIKFNVGMSSEESERTFEQLQWLRDTSLIDFPLGPDFTAAPIQTFPRWVAPAPGQSGPFELDPNDIASVYGGRRGWTTLQEVLDFYNARGQTNDFITVDDLTLTDQGTYLITPTINHSLVASTPSSTPYALDDSNGGIALTLARGVMELESYYVSADWKINDILKANVGVRHEEFSITYDDDPNFPGIVIGSDSFVLQDIDAEGIDEEVNLPAFTFIAEPTDELTFRLAASDTVGRPTYREIAPFISLNPNEDIVEIGNPGRVLTGRAPLLDPFVDRNENGIPDAGDNTPESTVFTTGGAALPILLYDQNGQSFYSSPTGTGIIRNPDYSESNDYAGLTTGKVENFDIRAEYSQGNYLFAFSFFAKKVSDPIEQISLSPPGDVGASSLYTYINNENEADIAGVELEAQADLGFLFRQQGTWLDNIAIGANYTHIDAVVERSNLEKQIARQGGSPEVAEAFDSLGNERSLFDQPERLANAFVSVEVPDWGSRFTLSGTLTGRQLFVVGSAESHPDLFLEETIGLNFVWEQSIGETFSLKFSAKNINSPTREIQRDDRFLSALEAAGGSVSDRLGTLRSSYDVQPTYSLSISASF